MVIYKISYNDLETDIMQEEYYSCHAKATHRSLTIIYNLIDSKELTYLGESIYFCPIEDVFNQQWRIDNNLVNTKIHNGDRLLAKFKYKDYSLDDYYDVRIEKIEVL